MIAESYLPILILLILGVVFAGVFALAGYLLGPKKDSAAKASPFESGFMSKGITGQRYDVKFYMTALVFLIFDVEVVFLYPWAVQLKQLGWYGFTEGVLFIALLGLGLAYVWKKGALEWE